MASASPPPPGDLMAYLEILKNVVLDLLREGGELIRTQGHEGVSALPWVTLGLWVFALLGLVTFVRWLWANVLRLATLGVILMGVLYLRAGV